MKLTLTCFYTMTLFTCLINAKYITYDLNITNINLESLNKRRILVTSGLSKSTPNALISGNYQNRQDYINSLKNFQTNLKTPKNQINASLTNSNLSNSKLGNSNLGTSKLGNSNLGTSKLSNSNLGNSKLSNSNLGNSKLSNSNLGTSKLGNSNLGTSKLGNSNLGTSKLGNSNLGTSKLSNSDLGKSESESLSHSNYKLSQESIVIFKQAEFITRKNQYKINEIMRKFTEHQNIKTNINFKLTEKIFLAENKNSRELISTEFIESSIVVPFKKEDIQSIEYILSLGQPWFLRIFNKDSQFSFKDESKINANFKNEGRKLNYIATWLELNEEGKLSILIECDFKLNREDYVKIL